jgi:hypothetical protein
MLEVFDHHEQVPPEGRVKKSDREIMEILEAFDATESAHSAAQLAGVDPKTACMTCRASWLQVVVATVAVGEGSGSCRFSGSSQMRV